MEWSESKCLELIEIYRTKSLLWDPKDKNHFRNDLKQDAWREIGEALGVSGGQCKQKMINLLASFRREKKKIKDSMSTGQGKSLMLITQMYNCKMYFIKNYLHVFRKGRYLHK